MLNRTFFILITFISVLLFSSQKSKATTCANAKYKIHSNFLKKPIQSSNNNAQDFIINEDNDDDETSSKLRLKFSKVSLITNYKFNRVTTSFTLSNCNKFYFSDFSRNHSKSCFVFAKTPITLAIRCLRI